MDSRTFIPRIPSVQQIQNGLCQRLGYGDTSELPSNLFNRFQGALDLAIGLAKPRSMFRTTAIEAVDQRVIRGNGIHIHSEQWAKVGSSMEPPGVILVFAVTLGEALDHRIGLVQKKSLTMGYLLDAAGSEIIECVAKGLEDELWKIPSLRSYQRTHRFSPGYCDWGLEGQQAVFDFLQAEKLGIIHTKAWGMVPSKSITAAVLGARHIPSRSPCGRCNEKCAYRRGLWASAKEERKGRRTCVD